MAKENYKLRPKLKIQVLQSGQPVKDDTFVEFPIIFGRSTDCKLQLSEWAFISRIHGSISLDKNEIVVTDLGSLRGLRSNGQRVQLLRGLQKIEFTIQDLTFLLTLEGQENESHDTKTIKGFRPTAPTDGRPAPGVSFSLAPVEEISGAPVDNLGFQGVITWQESIYDIRNFKVGDRLILGPHPTEPIYLPTANQVLNFGYYSSKGAMIRVDAKTQWGLYRETEFISLSQLTAENKIHSSSKSHHLISLKSKEVLSINLGYGLALHFRYVPTPGYFVQRTLIENRDEFKTAIITSGLIHFIMCIMALFSTPKYEARTIENVPPRIAKLIFEPPIQILAPPPKPIELPKPPIEPELKEVIPPKTIKKEVAKKNTQRVEKRKDRPVAKTQPEPQDLPKTETPTTQNDIADIFKALPSAKGTTKAGENIQIRKEQTSASGVKVSAIAALQNTKSNNSPNSSGEIFKVGSSGYSKSGMNKKTGKRGILGAVVGTPDYSSKVESVQGLTQEEVMQVVNRHLSDMQRCYERALFDDPNIKGKVEYEWEINPRGSVVRAMVYKSEIARADILNNCVLGLFKKMKFPVAKNGQATIAKIGFPYGSN